MKLNRKTAKNLRVNLMFGSVELKLFGVDFLNIDHNFIMSSFSCLSRESLFNDFLKGFQMNDFFKSSKLVRFNLLKLGMRDEILIYFFKRKDFCERSISGTR